MKNRPTCFTSDGSSLLFFLKGDYVLIVPQTVTCADMLGRFQPTLMLSPCEIASCFRLPEHFVRELVKNGSVVSVRVGRRILVNAESVKRYLNTGVPQGASPETNAPSQAAKPTAPSGGKLAPISLKSHC